VRTKVCVYIVGLVGLPVLLSACGKMNQNRLEQPDFKLQCVAVLPTASVAETEHSLSTAEEMSLRQETEALDTSLRNYFGARSDIKFIKQDQAGQANSPRQALEQAKTVAAESGCNAVLETFAHRYKERIGGEYTAKEPAAAAFSWRLLAMPEGNVLCHGRFDEEQQPLFANLLNFRRSAENSFTWVTAERLLSQNLHEQLAQCSYLEK
jgi:hypothetical protein